MSQAETMDPKQLSDWLSAAREIGAEAGRHTVAYFRKPLDVVSKADASPVTVADRETEELIRERLTERFPEHGIFGEEFGTVGSDSRYLWIVDPIDGTKSFISGMPLFSTLIALYDQQQQQSLLGVLTFPGLDEQYSAAAGQGAFRETRKLKVAVGKKLEKAIVYVNEGDRILAADAGVLERLGSACALMRFSYDAYSYGLLAEGHVDAVIDYGLKPYDYMPAVTLVHEAGGVMSDWLGQPLSMDSDGRVVAASSLALHRELLAICCGSGKVD